MAGSPDSALRSARARGSDMSDLKYAEILERCKDIAAEDADKAFSRTAHRDHKAWYQRRVLREYISHISPIGYDEVIEYPDD